MAAVHYRLVLFAAVIAIAVTSATAAPLVTTTTPPSITPNVNHQFVESKYTTDDLKRQSWASPFDLIKEQTSSLVKIGREIVHPSTSWLDSASPNSTTKSLPALPGAVFMAMIGFLSVTLVRDRKFWISVFVGLVLLSQMGVQTIPKLTARLIRAKLQKNQTMASVAKSGHLNHSLTLVKGYNRTFYVGLLHRLADSTDEDGYLINIARGANSLGNLNKILSRGETATWTAVGNRSSAQPAFITNHYNIRLSSLYRAGHAEPTKYFSPAFIFENLPRGPPL